MSHQYEIGTHALENEAIFWSNFHAKKAMSILDPYIYVIKKQLVLIFSYDSQQREKSEAKRKKLRKNYNLHSVCSHFSIGIYSELIFFFSISLSLVWPVYVSNTFNRQFYRYYLSINMFEHHYVVCVCVYVHMSDISECGPKYWWQK